MEQRLLNVLMKLGYAQNELILESSDGKVGGYILSTRFQEKSQMDRQNELWAKLSQHMDQHDLVNITAILTMTPEEVGD